MWSGQPHGLSRESKGASKHFGDEESYKKQQMQKRRGRKNTTEGKSNQYHAMHVIDAMSCQ